MDLKKELPKEKMITANDIKQAYIEKIGHNIGSGHIYIILAKHGWKKGIPGRRHPKSAKPEVIEASKKINRKISETINCLKSKRVRFMYQDEAGFGRIGVPKYCWCPAGECPNAACHHIREYRYAYGAVEPMSGDGFFLIMPGCNTNCMNVFLLELSKRFKEDYIILYCDGAV